MRAIRGVPSGLASGTVGAISEMRAAIDLMGQGFEVFRALSPSCSCDLAVLKNGAVVRVEVRTGLVLTDGSLTAYLRANEAGRADVLAVVGTDRISYRALTEAGRLVVGVEERTA